MSWTARITKAPDDSLRLQFSEPLRHIDMDRATARHLAALLVVASNGARCEPLENTATGDGEPETALTPLNAPRAKNSHERLGQVTPQPKTSKTVFKTFMAENKPKRLSRPTTGRQSRATRDTVARIVRRTAGRT